MNPTAYDDACKTLIVDHTHLMIAVINEVFGTDYTGGERIEFLPAEHFLPDSEGGGRKIISDSCFRIVRDDGTSVKYHIESQSTPDGTILIRMAEYDISIAIEDGNVDGNTLTITIPESAVIMLRSNSAVPDIMNVVINAGGGSLKYHVRVMKVQKYSVEDIFLKKLWFLIPFRIFAHESRFAEYESSCERLRELTGEYRDMFARLDALREAGEISDYTYRAVRDMSAEVLGLIAHKYAGIRKGVEGILGGKVLDYEAKRIYTAGIAEGRAEGRAEGIISMGRKYHIPDSDIISQLVESLKCTVSDAARMLETA